MVSAIALPCLLLSLYGQIVASPNGLWFEVQQRNITFQLVGRVSSLGCSTHFSTGLSVCAAAPALGHDNHVGWLCALPGGLRPLTWILIPKVIVSPEHHNVLLYTVVSYAQ
jgi:hypothetical protein